MLITSTLVEELRKIISSRWFLTHLGRHDKSPNFWSILEYGKSSYEIRYLRMLRWLMDPKGDHGLGAYISRELIRLVDSEAADRLSGVYVPSKKDVVRNEGINSSGGIDVLLYEEAASLCVAVENKVYADESFPVNEQSQLHRYHDAVQGHHTFSAAENKFFLFLTLDGHSLKTSGGWGKGDQFDPPAYYEDWKPISYSELNGILEAAIEKLLEEPLVDEFGMLTNSGHVYKIIDDFIVDNKSKVDLLTRHREEIEGFRTHEEELASIVQALDDEERGESAANGDLESEGLNILDEIGEDLNLETRLVERALVDIYEALASSTADHTPNGGVKRIIEKVSEAFVGHVLHPKESCALPEGKREATGFSHMRRSQGKGQGLYWYASDDVRSKEHLYISGASNGNLPNDTPSFRDYAERAGVPVAQQNVEGWDDLGINRLMNLLIGWLKENQFPGEGRDEV
ncbi:PD-(D/E)XK nuclease family protein [Kocuria palustris]|uniref:PD-(D/E)XK nuclease family protein n=1 Tax=Kocuria palustris TaxID=71999 RepID=UPI003D729A9B